MRLNELCNECKQCKHLKAWAMDMSGNHLMWCMAHSRAAFRNQTGYCEQFEEVDENETN